MLFPIQIQNEETKTLACVHWKLFPPKAALVAKQEGKDITYLVKRRLLSSGDLQQGQVWEKCCGKFNMDEECLSCPHARYAIYKNGLPCLSTLDGKLVSPVLDLPTLESKMSRSQCLVSSPLRK